jgi:hypothetical protein
MNFTIIDVGITAELLGVCVLGRDRAVVVGRGGAVVRWDGTHWFRDDAGIDEDLYAVWGSGEELWAVGGNLNVGGHSLVCRYAGGRWTAERSGIQSLLLSVSGDRNMAVRAVGFNGVMVERTATGWRERSIGTNEHLFCIRALRDGSWVGCGLNGTIRVLDGDTARTQVVASTHLTCVAETADGLLAVGFDGTVLRRDGETWHSLASPVREHLWSVWSDGEVALAVGAGGTVIRCVGPAVDSVASPTTADLHAISGADGWVVAVGRHGTILVGEAGVRG